MKIPWYSRLFQYCRNIWEGKDGKPSIKRLLAIYFSYCLVSNTNFAIRRWSEGKSLSDLALVLGILAGAIMGLLGITSYYNYLERKLSQQNGGTLPPGGVE